MNIRHHVTLIFFLISITTNTIANQKSESNQINFQIIKQYAELASASYMSKTELRQSTLSKDYTYLQTGNISEVNIFYLLVTNVKNKTQYVAVRGTHNIENTIVNFTLQLTLDKNTGIYLHNGFLQAAQAIYKEIKPYLKKDYTINTTGHSMGGAVANIVAMYLTNDKFKLNQVITFGQPKITNVAGAYKYRHLNVIRVVTQKDLVPLVPFLDPMDITNIDIYWHLGKEIILLPGTSFSIIEGVNSMLRATKFTQQSLTEINFSNHKMDKYLEMIDKKIPIAVSVPFKNSLNLFNLFGNTKN